MDDQNFDNGNTKTKKRAWEILFDNENLKGENFMILNNLVGKKVKVWSAFNDTIGGIKGTFKGTVGVLTNIDDEFIVLDQNILLSRKFIFRIEIA